MKGAREKEQDWEAEVRAKFAQLRTLFGGLRRARRDYPAVESINFEPLPGGQVLELRMLYPFEILCIELSDEQVSELVNRAQGRTPEGVQVATPAEAAAILGEAN